MIQLNQLILLFLIIIIPIVLSIFAITLKLGKGDSYLQKIKSTIELNEECGLSEQGLLWYAILLPVFYFFIFGLVSWCNYDISVTSDGLEKFISISLFPLGFLSLIIPLSVFVSRLHGTKQTAAQIRITKLKNNPDLFNAHRKELFSYFSQIGEIKYLNCLVGTYKVHPRVHRIFFQGKPEDGTPRINESEFRNIQKRLQSARTYLYFTITDSNTSSAYSFYIYFCTEIYRLGINLGLSEICNTLSEKGSYFIVVNAKNKEEEVLTVGTTTDEAVAAYRYIRSYFNNLCDFSGYELETVKYDPTGKEMETIEHDDIKYIDNGVKFRTLEGNNVIERLHCEHIQKNSSC